MLTWADGGALLAVFVWGVNFPVLKAIMTVVDPLPTMLLRAAISALTLVGVLALRGEWRLPARHEVGALLPVALIGFTANQVLYNFGLHLTTASHSGLIFTITPLFVFGLSHALGHVRMGRLDVAGVLLGLAGAVLILGGPGGSGDRQSGATLLGDLLTVGAALTWGAWTIFAVPILQRHGTLLGSAWITGMGALGLLPIALPGLVTQPWAGVPWTVLGAVVYAATVGGALGGVLWYAAVRRLGAARTAVYANLESFFAVVAAALMLGERVSWLSLVGGGAVAAGVLLTRRGGGARRP